MQYRSPNGLWRIGTLISAAQCRVYAAEYQRQANAAGTSLRRATALLALAHDWEILGDDMERYEAIIQTET